MTGLTGRYPGEQIQWTSASKLRYRKFEVANLPVEVEVDTPAVPRNTARLISMFQQFEGLAERIRLVINRAGSIEMEISRKKSEEILKMPISWEIPNMTKIFQAARIRGVPIGDIAKGSRPHQVYLEMARALRPVPEGQASNKRKGIFAALF